MHTSAARCESNSLKIFDHHGTKGFNHSFGNKPLYVNSDGSSVSTYTQLKRKNKNKQEKRILETKHIHQKCAETIHDGIFHSSKLIPEIKHFLCPIINAAYDRQCRDDIHLLTPEDTSNGGFWIF